ncbi:pyridine nucleotide-disulfide-related oxidoreductase [Reticulomyxa filosa]|uniref:Pyridine nucleotide-disulfide-related oxidoreductase n=1 Tax=Reticulomyxa filosa TaxID=46433 RepID=X6MR10_RETFI|nr:pyridine nucleotide-disulfide-related oxidoreductase [Reticulomyxa filosa]|eukprot:ETO16294.1 pyridine nucleotide-disulfide-related oxidoreductase [Reticulomyxa filosa]
MDDIECEVVETKSLCVDKVILAIGRVPNVGSLQLDKANVKMNDRGTLEVDEHLRSVTSPHIYAAGDALGKWGLVAVAEMEGRHAVERMFGTKNPATKLEYKHISSVMFVRPGNNILIPFICIAMKSIIKIEIACVGMNEQEAIARRLCYKSGFLRFGLINRAVIDWSERHSGPIEPKRAGFIKMICTDDEEKILLGMRAVGVDASSVIGSGALLIRRGESIRELEKTAHPHPSIIESVQECARLLLGRSLYKPHVWPKTHVKHYSPEKGSALAQELLPKRLRQMIPGYMEA